MEHVAIRDERYLGRQRQAQIRRALAPAHRDKNEKYHYDWFSTEWRVDDVVQNADDLAILRINAGS